MQAKNLQEQYYLSYAFPSVDIDYKVEINNTYILSLVGQNFVRYPVIFSWMEIR